MVAAAAGGATPVQAAAKSDTIRQPVLPNCGGDYFMPCKGRPWYLFMRDGRWTEFPDAGRYATEADGSRADEVEDDPAPFALSGDGRTIAYVRARDSRVVVKRWPQGKAHVLPAWGDGVGTKYMDLMLSADGRRLLVDFSSAARKRPGLAVDVASGATVRTFPAGDDLLGFSADGNEVLATEPKTTKSDTVLAYKLKGSSVRATLSERYTFETPALAADGHTVITLRDDDQVRPFDLKARAWAGSGRSLKPRQGGAELVWGPSGRLELRSALEVPEEGRNTYWRYSLNAKTGATKLLDTYSFRPAMPGKK